MSLFLICILKGFLSDEGPLFYFMNSVNCFEYFALVVNVCCKAFFLGLTFCCFR